MPLDKQNIPIAFGQGINTKDDPKQLVPGKLTVLQNGVFSVGKEIKKRNGYTALSKNIQGGGTIGTGVFVTSYNNELLESDGSSLYSYSSAATNWVSKGTLVNTNLSVSTVVRNTTQQTIQDSAINGNYKAFCWYDSLGQLGYSIVDSATGQSVVNNQQLSSGGTIVKVLTLSTNFVFIYYEAGALKYKTVSTSTPTTLSSSTTIASDVDTGTKAFDASVFNSRIYIVYSTSVSNRTSMYYLDSSLVLSTKLNVTTTGVGNCVTVVGDASFNAWVSYGTTGTLGTCYVFIANPNLSSVTVASTLLEAPSGGGVRNVTGIVSGTIGTFYYECANTASFVSTELTPNRVRTNTFTLAGVAGTAASFLRGIGLASKVFSYASVNYLMVAFQSTLQSSYFLMNGAGKVVLKLSPDTGGGYTTASILPEVNTVSSGVFETASLVKDLLIAVDGVLSTQTGVLAAQMSFPPTPSSIITLGQNQMFSGGIVEMYDGGSVVEHGYSVFPEGGTASFALSGTGALGIAASSATTNQLQYCSTYEWTDNQGQIHRSAPSIPITLEVPTTFVSGELTANYDHTHGGTLTSLSSTAGLAVGMTVDTVDGASFPPYRISFQSGTIDTISGSTITGSFLTSSLAGTGSINLVVSSTPINLFNVSIKAGSSTGSTHFTPVVGTVIQGLGAASGGFLAGTTVTGFDYNTGIVSFSNASAIDGFGVDLLLYSTDINSASIVVPTIKLSTKNKISIVLYRTEVNLPVFYRQSSVTSPTYNDTSVDYVTFTDNTADAVLVGNEQLYTTGGEVENIEVPATTVMTTFKSRAVAVPADSQLSWWYSKQVIPGAPVEFNDSFVGNVDSRIQRISGVGVMDEKIIFFGPTSKYYVVGDGPAPSGANNDFSQAQHITGSTGCSNQNSILEIPVGLIYQDPTKGIYLLDRSLSEVYIGQEVAQYNLDPITSAQTIPGTTSVRFTLTSGTVLVYDWFYNQWGNDPYVAEAISSTLSGTLFTYVQANGLVLQESSGTFSDNGAFYSLAPTTGWMSFGGIEGFQRVYELLLLGNYKSPHTLNVTIYTDYNDTTPTQTVTIPVTSDPVQYQYRIRLTQQKCTAIKISISDSSQTGTGESYSLSSMAFRVGVKQGLNKLPAAQSY